MKIHWETGIPLEACANVHGKDSVWWHGSQETQKETQQWYELEYREAFKGTWESIEVNGVQGVAPLSSTPLTRPSPHQGHSML